LRRIHPAFLSVGAEQPFAALIQVIEEIVWNGSSQWNFFLDAKLQNG